MIKVVLGTLTALLIGSGALYGNEKATDGELLKFGQAYSQVLEVRQVMSQKIAGTSDPEKKKELNLQAREKMQKVIKQAGLTVPRFNELARALDSDRDLQKRFKKLMDDS